MNDTITIRLNKEEREQLERIKGFLNLTSQFGGDSKAMKGCLNFVENVTHRWFGGNLGTLFYPRKVRETLPELERDNVRCGQKRPCFNCLSWLELISRPISLPNPPRDTNRPFYPTFIPREPIPEHSFPIITKISSFLFFF